jgi:hypothetical protein
LPESTATPGVTRIVKLGEQKLLIMRIQNGQDVPEGDYTVNGIQAVPSPGIVGADGICAGECTLCGLNLVVRL